MTKNVSSFRLLLAALALFTAVSLSGFGGAARAQTSPYPPGEGVEDGNQIDLGGLSTLMPEVYSTVDENGIDLTSGRFIHSQTLLTTGSGELSYTVSRNGDSERDNLIGTLNGTGEPTTTEWFVSFGSTTESFDALNTINQYGAKLQKSGSIYTYTGGDGTVATFDQDLASNFPHKANLGRITSLIRPNGLRYDYYYQETTTVVSGTTYDKVNLISVTTNTGWQFRHPEAGGTPQMINMGYDYCNPAATGTCSGMSESWPGLMDGAAYTGTGSSRTFTTPEGVTVTHGLSGGKVTSVTRGGGTWTYAYTTSGTSPDGSARYRTTVTDPSGDTRRVWIQGSTGQILINEDKLGRTTNFEYYTNNRLKKVTRPSGAWTQYTYDSRGNTTQVQNGATGETTVTVTAGYPGSCSNFKTCNQPSWTKDAFGKQTDYTYSGTHGGLASVTAPAPYSGAQRPKVSHAYDDFYAWYENSSGNIVQAPSLVWKRTETGTCRTATTCNGSANKLETTLEYQAGSSSQYSNLQVTAQSVGAGNDGSPATTTYTYDRFGRTIWIDGPLSGTGDRVRTRHDWHGRLTGFNNVDPDGSGPLKYGALQYDYDDDGRVTEVRIGHTTGQGNAQWGGFTTMRRQTYHYDSHGRFVKEMASQGSIILSVAQVSYDNESRPTCTALRMNPTWFATPPSTACALGNTGSYGRDRLTLRAYDDGDRVTAISRGFDGTNYARVETMTYHSTHGAIETVTDGNGNITKYSFDGFGRVERVQYPDATTGVPSTSDDEWFVYDAASQVIETTLRDNQKIYNTYDDLGRLTLVNAPGSANDITYTYDYLGAPLTIAEGGETLTYTYDALGRKLTETSPLGTINSAYDDAGQRILVQYPGPFSINYTYNNDGSMETVSKASSLLATYEYSQLGRRIGVTRNGGPDTSYSHSDVARSGTISHDFSGTSFDQDLEFDFNPAGQITEMINDNSQYDAVMADIDRTFTANGLNQILESGSIDGSDYDARGNMIGDGSKTYGYDVFNRLTSVSGGVSMAYDPAGRLSRVAKTGQAATKFLYDGARMVAEYSDGGSIQRRYVYGAGLDEVLVWYEGGGTSNLRWLTTDHLGSVTAVTSSSGTSVNTYDEYGMPQSGNTGRFQYTGQMWIEEAELYHYKMRAYNPQLGRFMQTDPIGYGDGLNMYAYVGNDPVNATDPMGLKTCTGSRIKRAASYDCNALYAGTGPEEEPEVNAEKAHAGGGGGGGDDDSDGHIKFGPSSSEAEGDWIIVTGTERRIVTAFPSIGVSYVSYAGGRTDRWSQVCTNFVDSSTSCNGFSSSDEIMVRLQAYEGGNSAVDITASAIERDGNGGAKQYACGRAPLCNDWAGGLRTTVFNSEASVVIRIRGLTCQFTCTWYVSWSERVVADNQSQGIVTVYKKTTLGYW